MEFILLLMGISALAGMSKFLLRIFLTVKNPALRDAWDEAEGREAARRKSMAGGAFKAGIGIAKMFRK